MIKLSILIPTLKERYNSFANLYSNLHKQVSLLPISEYVEILHISDNREISIGEKRNKLLSMAKGEFSVFIDDDDRVSNLYINNIVNSIINNKDIDCVGFKGIITFDGKNPKEFIHSLKYREYSQNDATYFRPPNHLNPIKSTISKAFKFKEINFGEDTDWAMAICNSGLLKNEYMIESDIMYYYDYISTKK